MSKIKKPLKIAFCGARSTGKTTLARALAKKLDIPYLSEVAREVLERDSSKESPLRKQIEIYESQIKKEKALSSFVSCRSMLDIEAFNMEYPSLFELALLRTNYDYIFYIPIIEEIPFEHDSIRGSSDMERFDENTRILHVLFKAIEFRELYLNEACKIRILYKKSLKSRTKEVLSYIERREDGVF